MFSRVIVIVSYLGVNVLLVRMLGLEQKGFQALFFNQVYLLLFVFQMLGGNALIFLTQRFSISKLFYYHIVWSLVCLFGGVFLFLLFDNQSILACLATFIIALHFTNLQFLSRKENYKFYSLLSSFPAIFSFLVLLYYYWNSQEINLFLFYCFWIISHLLSVILSTYLLRKDLHLFKWEKLEFLEIFKISFESRIALILFSVSSRIFFYMVSKELNAVEFGLFALLYSFFEGFLVIGQSFSLKMYSYIINNSIAIEKAGQVLVSNLTIASLITVLGILVMILIPVNYFELIFKVSLPEFVKIVLVMLISALFVNLYFVISSYFNSYGYFKVLNMVLLIHLILVLLFSFLMLNFKFDLFEIVYMLLISNVLLLFVIVFVYLNLKQKHDKRIHESI